MKRSVALLSMRDPRRGSSNDGALVVESTDTYVRAMQSGAREERPAERAGITGEDSAVITANRKRHANRSA